MNNSINENKVSVIIATYNRAKFITNAVKSIIDQDYDNIEIIIVDDGSNDNTKEVVASLQSKYSNIIYCSNKRSKGVCGARNTGIALSSGNFIAFLDSDDIWLNGHIRDGLDILRKNSDIDVLFGNFRVVDYESGKDIYTFFNQKKLLGTLNYLQITSGIKILNDNLFIALLNENFFSIVGTILRIQSCKNIFFDESVKFAEDRDFGIQLYKQANATFAVREDPVFIAYRHSSNTYTTNNTNINQLVTEAHIYLFKKYLVDLILSSDEKRILTKLIAEKLSSLSYIYVRNKVNRNAVSLIRESFKYGLTYTQLKNSIKTLIAFLLFNKGLNHHNSG